MSKTPIFFLSLIVVLSACQKRQNADVIADNFVSLSQFQSAKSIGDDTHQFQIDKLRTLDNESLIIKYPQSLIGERSLFVGTIIEVSNREDESMGGMKLSNFSPAIVRSRIAIQDSKKEFQLWGCLKDCGERSKESLIIGVPVLGEDHETATLTLDLSELGRRLNILDKINDQESPLEGEWKLVKAHTRSFDYSLSTLVFDVVTDYQVTQDGKTQNVSLTTRWSLRLDSFSTPFFESRPAIPEVGFFTTERNSKNWIQRFRTVTEDSGPIKYYIKNVPLEYRPGFVDSFDAWNEKMKSAFGRDFLAYEFLEENDPRNQQIITGDLRFNVIEWDLVNQAGYGGLGPSLAHPQTGEIFTGLVLVQGPKVIDLYKPWFEAKKPSPQPARVRVPKARLFQIRLANWEAQIPAQDPRLQDRLEARMDFTPPPEGYDFLTYMRGYFRDMVAHEIGHNLGLRHNFRASLADDGSRQLGSVSRSIMEYLGAQHRHLNTVGDYDVMALSYGHLGIKPTHANWYCTDEDSDSSSSHSAECSSSDASQDPFEYLSNTLNLVMRKSVAFGSVDAPDWTPEDLARHISVSVEGLARYATSAMTTAAQWTNFSSQGADRPKEVSKIPMYVVQKLRTEICAPEWDQSVAFKDAPEKKAATRENLKKVRASIAKTIQGFKEPFPLGVKELFPCLDFEASLKQ